MEKNVLYAQKFLKNFRQRIASNSKLAKKFNLRVKQFINNPRYPLLRDHQLTGKKTGMRAFSVTGDIRVIYREISQNLIIFLDIGSHNQVY